MEECSVFDLRVAQSFQDRGIPRYIGNLMSQLTQDFPDISYYFMLDKTLPTPAFHDKLSNFGTFFFVEDGHSLFKKKHVKNYFISCFPLTSIKHNFFETLFPHFLYGHAPSILGIVWDLIPKIFPDRYLTPEFKAYCLPAYAAMREADHLFAISEQSAYDAHHLLDIPLSKISNIYGGVCLEVTDAISKTPQYEEFLVYPFGKLSNGKYYVYIGGDEWRKNLAGIIEAYGILARQSTTEPLYPLVIICSLSEGSIKNLYNISLKMGLRPKKDVIITGHLSDIDLVRIVKNAKGMIFPSFYEGLGLPVLESYACGIPVIGSATSSIKEIVPPECTFDPHDPMSIAKKIEEFTHNPELKKASLEFGKAILKKMTWQNAASKIGPFLKKSKSPQEIISIKKKDTNTLAVFTTLPPDKSGIADYSYEVFKKASFPIHYYYQHPFNHDEVPPTDIPIFHPRIFDLLNKVYDYKKILFVLGNSHHHVPTLKALMENYFDPSCEKFLYLHDANLSGLWYCYFKNNIDQMNEFFSFAYPRNRFDSSQIKGLRPILQRIKVRKVFTNSDHATAQLLLEADDLKDVGFESLFLPIVDQPLLKVPTDNQKSDICIGHFGIISPSKHLNVLIDACEILHKKHSVKLVLAGYNVERDFYENKLKKLPFIELVNSPSKTQLFAIMQEVDLAVQLRWPFHGESSGVVNQLLSLDKPVIATDIGSFRDYQECLQLTRANISPFELSQVMQKTLDQSQELKVKIGQLKKNFSVEVFLEKFERALKE